MSLVQAPLKWAGSKRNCFEAIKPYLPEGNRLIEPFVGSGTVFLNTDYKEYLLCDINPDLINLFRFIKEQPDHVVTEGKRIFTPRNNNPQQYYQLRKQFNETKDIERKAILFLYLNRHGFNGLCRYSLKGNYNVAFGSYKKPYFPEKEIYLFSEKAKNATFITSSFEDTLTNLKDGDVIYADPPYTPLEGSVGFTSYHGGTFGLEKHKLLLECLESTNRPFTISNHETNVTKTLYSKLNIHTFPVRRSISCVGDTRFQVNELVAYN